MNSRNKDDIRGKDDLKKGDGLKKEDELKNEDCLKWEYNLKNAAKWNMSNAMCALSMCKSLAPTPIYMYSFALVVFT